MAITHNLSEPANLGAGGTWFDDYGRRICTWTWDSASREIEVRCGPHGKRITLPASVMGLTPENLGARLTRIAIETAEQINGVKYDV